MRIAIVFAFITVLAAPAAAQSVPVNTAPPATAAAAPTGAEINGYNYDAAGRRDPFISLLRRAVDPQRQTVGVRPAGLAGLTTSEIVLKGTMRAQDGFLGIVLGSDQKSYIVRSGDRLLDGTVRAIAPDALVIVQQVNDPLSSQKQREVRKTLRQTEEAK